MAENSIVLILVAFLTLAGIFTLLVIYLYFMHSSSGIKERLSRYIERPSDVIEERHVVGYRSERVSRFRYRINNFLSVFISEKLYQRLQSSNWQITVTEYVLIQIFGSLVGLGLGWLISRTFYIGVIVAIIVYMLPGIFLYRSIYLRQKKFQDQLVDVLVLIRGAVQAGFSLLQALDVVVKEMPNPAQEEFGRLQREVQLGIPFSQSLENLAERMESDDLNMVVTAIIINSQVGGNLSQMLTAVTETIRNRVALFGEVRALTSYARYTSYLLSFMPFITALIVVLLSPGYFSSVGDSPITRMLFILAFTGILIGNIWMRQLAKIKI